LDEPGADRAQEIFEAVENSRVLGYITTESLTLLGGDGDL
jgi:hypothetical protein